MVLVIYCLCDAANLAVFSLREMFEMKCNTVFWIRIWLKTSPLFDKNCFEFQLMLVFSVLLTYIHKWIEKSIALCGGSYMLVKDTQNVLNVVASKHHLCFMQQFYVIASSRQASLSLYMSRVFISPLTFKQWSQIISAWLNRGNPLVRFLVECHDIIYK